METQAEAARIAELRQAEAARNRLERTIDRMITDGATSDQLTPLRLELRTVRNRYFDICRILGGRVSANFSRKDSR